MGNKLSNLQIERYFEKGIVVLDKNETILLHVKLSPPAMNKHGNKVETLWFGFTPEGSVIYGEKKQIESLDCIFLDEWKPKSHLRDFEVLNAFSENEIKIGRSKGVGVLIIEPFEMYVKLYRDKNSNHGIVPVIYKWNHSVNSKKVLNCDLDIGYDVLLVDSDFEHYHLCEERDERDKQETMILFKDFEQYK